MGMTTTTRITEANGGENGGRNSGSAQLWQHWKNSSKRLVELNTLRMSFADAEKRKDLVEELGEARNAKEKLPYSEIKYLN
jgi:Fe-S cluster biosynthesis and repair protein YggX